MSNIERLREIRRGLRETSAIIDEMIKFEEQRQSFTNKLSNKMEKKEESFLVELPIHHEL